MWHPLVRHAQRYGIVLIAMKRPSRFRHYGSIAVAKQVGLSLRQLYYWVEVLRIVTPRMQPHGRRVFRAFTGLDIQRLEAVKRLLSRGYTLQAAARKARAR